MSAPTIFISYSHRDEEWKDKLVTHLKVLQMEDLLEVWDDWSIQGGDEWYPEIEQAIERASVAVLLVSAEFLTSDFILKNEIPRLLQRRARGGLCVFPVIAKPCAWQRVHWLAPILARPKDGRPLSAGDTHRIDVDLAAIALEIEGIIRQASHQTTFGGHPLSVPEKVSLARLPSTSPDLFGRDKELATLDMAWENPQTNLVSLVAWGGVGKTALVNVWLNHMGQGRYRGAERVYGWSFYSQGAAEDQQSSAELFITNALQWFGDPDPDAGSPWDKGDRLAGLVQQQRTLLILDGLEPLQYPPGESGQEGRLKDPGLRSLLRGLARLNPGLCVLTTRLSLDDLKEFTGTLAVHIDLEELSTEAGMQLLESTGVRGAPGELEQAVGEFEGHALALTLLGQYLTTVYAGDIRKRDRIPRLTVERRHGDHARRVMESYEQWFDGKPELEILRVIGLFDRPVEEGARQAVVAEPAIEGLTSSLVHLYHEDWQFALGNLRRARLLDPPDLQAPSTLDCHPLVREHFGQKLKTSSPPAWREAHSRLYEHYKTNAKQFPDTLEEMTPLYVALGHGCQSGQHQEALDEVFFQRVRRRNEGFSLRRLGAFGSDLAALSGFFELPWRQPVVGLTEDYKGFVLGEAGFDLQALARLVEASQPMQAALETRIAQESWENAAIAAYNISDLYVTIGDLNKALAYAAQGKDLADRSRVVQLRYISRAFLANAHHQAGRLVDSEAIFQEAETIQRERQPQCPILYSLRGFQYCDLLLDLGKYRVVRIRAAQAQAIAERENASLLTFALDHLSLGRAYLLQAKQEDTGDLSQAANHLIQAVDGLRQTGRQDQLPLGLLARAGLHREQSNFDLAHQYLEEAASIAERGSMGLHQADCHLEYARLYLATGDKDQAREHLETAKEMVSLMGYHRRDREVQELGAQLVN